MTPAQFPEKFLPLFQPKRYKISKGGRAGARSWSFARALLLIGAKPDLLWPGRTGSIRVLCARETQKSIGESVHQLLEEQVDLLGLRNFYDVQKTTLIGRNGTEFIFCGIRQNVLNIKSYESCDICWVEEAQTVSKHSWQVLIPTIRKEGSEIWLTFNPMLETDETYQRFIVKPPKESIIITTTFRDNPWFPEVLRKEMEELREKDPDAYENVWEGACQQVVEGAIYRNELLAAEKENRIRPVPWEPTAPVHTFWDLGFGDNTSIWFAQSIGFEFRIIDFLEGSQQGLQYYLKELQNRPYIYGTHYLPHDAQAHELGSGRTIEEQIRAGGRRVQIVPKLSIADGIAAARAIFGKCYFDSEKCADGLQALRHYRFQAIEKLGTLSREPLHDAASHAADAFRYLAVALREPVKKPPPPREVPTQSNENSWMA